MSSVPYDPPSLDLPVPPPTPVHTVSSSDEYNASLHRSASYASSFQSTLVEQPTVDELLREAHDLKIKVAEVIGNLGTIAILRDQITQVEVPPMEELRKLSSLTTNAGQAISEIPGPMSAVRRGTEALGLLAKDGKAAATKMEVLQITEEIEVLKIEVAKSVDLIRSLAWEEVNNKEETKRRIDKLIRRENPMMSAEGLELAVHQAVAGSAERVGQLDVLSYAGRIAAENPFTELAVLLDTLQQPQKNAFGDSISVTNATENSHTHTEYEKLDHEIDLEAAPFTGLADGTGLSWKQPGESGKTVRAFLGRMRKNWRDWLVRGGLVITIIAVVVGLVTWETIAANQALNPDPTAYTESVARSTPTVLRRYA